VGTWALLPLGTLRCHQKNLWQCPSGEGSLTLAHQELKFAWDITVNAGPLSMETGQNGIV
jgi:hypothetical protein